MTVKSSIWESPFSVEILTRKSKIISEPKINNGDIYWLESRPEENGRTTIVSGDDLTPKYSVRSRVYEYGGGAYDIFNSKIIFVNDSDQCIYSDKRITEPGIRFSSLLITGRGIIAVAESHDNSQVDNYIALINPETGEVSKIISGNDFYSSPVINSDETKIAWISWNHPNMPWDSSELWVADIKENRISNPKMVAGGNNISVSEPKWHRNGRLYYVSDHTGWWNFYYWDGDNSNTICKFSADFSTPAWIQGISNWDFIGNNILCAYNKDGTKHLGVIDVGVGQLTPINIHATDINYIRAENSKAVMVLSYTNKPDELITLDLVDLSKTVIAVAQQNDISTDYISIPESINFESTDKRIINAWYYPPKNRDYVSEKLPPLIVKAHGGPTADAKPVYDPRIQFWTSRGFAVVDVNYAGSTGFGRRYRDSLKGKFGIYDWQDCESVAKYLIERRKADPEKIVIRGGSSGGYTCLCALTFSNIFVAGASYYGISDLEVLAKDTHKFEKYYLDTLIAEYPKYRSEYIKRSPIHNIDQLSTPIIFFQGEDDKVVPPSQSEMLHQALKKKNIPTELVIYPKEAHGFRQAHTIQDSLNKELSFYLSIFNTI